MTPDRPGHGGKRPTDGSDYRWNVLVALPGRPSDEVDAVLASIGSTEANTVVQLTGRSDGPRTAPSPNLAFAVAVPLTELLDDVDVAVLAGDVTTVLVALRARVPLVVLPARPAQAGIGSAVASVGAGVVAVSPEEVGAAVRAVALDATTGPRLRAVAEHVTAVDALLVALGTSALRLVGSDRRRHRSTPHP